MIEMPLDIPAGALQSAQAFLDTHQGAADTEIVEGIIRAAMPSLIGVTLMCYAMSAKCSADKARAMELAGSFLNEVEVIPWPS
jgi:hypothetical protein